jgi:hypothetical protein
MNIRVIDLLTAVGGAVLAAYLLAVTSHDALGLPRAEVREASLVAALALFVACIAGTLLRRNG